MLLLSRESPLKMSAELFPYENAQIQDNSFALLNEFTQYHQIDCVFEDQHKQQAIFVTQSYHTDHAVVNRLIDKVTVFKLVLGADAKLVQKQVTIALPEKQVNAKIIWTVTEN